MKNRDYPIILGLPQPTKEVILCRSKLGGFDMFVFDAEFPDGTKMGTYKSENFEEIKGLRCQIHFCNVEVMEELGKQLLNFAKKNKPKVRNSN